MKITSKIISKAEIVLTQERQDAILQLERDVIDINDMFKELGAMVSEQGEVIGSIEDNVTKAGDAVNIQITQQYHFLL